MLQLVVWCLTLVTCVGASRVFTGVHRRIWERSEWRTPCHRSQLRSMESECFNLPSVWCGTHARWSQSVSVSGTSRTWSTMPPMSNIVRKIHLVLVYLYKLVFNSNEKLSSLGSCQYPCLASCKFSPSDSSKNIFIKFWRKLKSVDSWWNKIYF